MLIAAKARISMIFFIAFYRLFFDLLQPATLIIRNMIKATWLVFLVGTTIIQQGPML